MQADSIGNALYGVGGDVNGMTSDAVRAYGGDPNRADWNLQLDAFLQVHPHESGQTLESLLPLTYTSSINEQPFVDFGGQFDALPKAKH
ncbi:hypothetical protein WL71_24755 [Burkholderia ubonensis]|uniref:Uncharacterized protein n=1 Tax=Burkholderia ubonensis TaxID=101571 RepID=A0A107F5Z2_9BURK|nr:hypothetical protein WL71_24755 [Burkholderia ubonensis]KWD87620.1 hypothetical protein WL70_09580 [Burkholderia ubonensis]KWD89763.1 hypothetical protein WL72_33005 [Burkholderia ubonensis]KWD96382.1 hypothetical protein WL73_23310 [Burkholderia ubonensis]